MNDMKLIESIYIVLLIQYFILLHYIIQLIIKIRF